MSRKLTPASTPENLKKEAKRWLAALRAGDAEARARLERALTSVHPEPTLRDVQLALAREHGLAGWTELRQALAELRAARGGSSRESPVQALLAAAHRGHADAVAALLEDHPDIIDTRGDVGDSGLRTALHFAVDGGHEAVARLLLERGADPNVRDEGDDAMPLHFAAEKGHMAMVRLLVEHGADPVGEGTVHELNVLGWAVCWDYAHRADVADYLLARGARHTIHTAVALGDAAVIREIAARAPADLEKPMDATNRRRRPLHLAVVKKRPEAVVALLELGADPDATDAAGLTPLDQAALDGEAGLAEILLGHGAALRLPAAVALGRTADVDRLLGEDPDCLRPGGRWDRLILRAAERASGPVIEALVRAGASVYARDDHRTAVDGTHGYTPLHAAAFNGNAEAARVLLRHGADPSAREDRYWGTPAGWADFAGHADVRDTILEGPIDICDAIVFDRNDRIPGILARDPEALERRLGAYVTGEAGSKPWLDPAWTPAAYAAAHGKVEALHVLVEHGADLTVRDSEGRTPAELARAKDRLEAAELLESVAADPRPRRSAPATRGRRVADFLRTACLDWRVGGSARATRMHDAGRLLAHEPGIARADLYTSVACGELEEVRRILDERPEAASEIGGPRAWPPLLYLCSARLPGSRWADDAVAVARLLLDHGADPNGFYLGGNADIHYTALTCLLGRGEEMASMHPRAPDLARLLLQRGADPHDNQVLYNVFADNTSRHLLDDDIVWLLELMHEHSVRRGHGADWEDPTWPMFDMRGAPSLGHEERRHHGARLLLEAAVDRNLLRLAGWLLARGAGPNTPAGNLWGRPSRTLYQEARVRGKMEMAELLARHGASAAPPELHGVDALVDACLAMDRRRVDALLEERPAYLRDPRPLIEVVKRDRVDAAEMLLDLGASPDVGDARSGGARPLHLAAAHGAVRCAALLLERGADVDPRETTYGSTPIGWASWFGQERTVELLARHSRDVWPLASNGYVERLRAVLVEEPARARVTGPGGHTPLMWLPDDEAAAAEVASLLLEHGADAGLRNQEGETAADIAARRGLSEAEALLRERERGGS